MKTPLLSIVAALALLGGCCHCGNHCTEGAQDGGYWMYVPQASSLALYGQSGRKIGVIQMAKNTRYCRPSEDGKSLEFAPVVIPPSTSAPTEYEYNEAGWYRNGVKPPTVPDGKVVSATTYLYDEANNEIVAEYTYEDAPAPVRTFSKLKLYAALTAAGKWDDFEAWLKTQTINGVNAYTAFSLAQDLTDANEMFKDLVESAKAALGVSDEFVETILNASLQEV